MFFSKTLNGLIMRFLVMLLLAVSLQGCASLAITSQPSIPPVTSIDNWPRNSLQAAGFDLAIMQQLDAQLDAGFYSNVHMLALEYDGKLVYEKYLSGEDENWGRPIGFRRFDRQSLHDLRSVSKSVTALLLGIALGDDFEAALSRPVVEYFPELSEQYAPGVEDVTLEQILTMSGGFEWNEMDVPYSNPQNDERQLYYADDPVAYLLSKPLRDQPGQRWYYNGGTTMLLAALVAKISGQDFLEFAEQKLAKPLGIEVANVEWHGLGIWQRPLPSAASGLRTRLLDLAKIGSLMLHDGKWQGRQVVPASWVRASSQRHIEQDYAKWSMDGVYGYGYQWWHGQFDGIWGDFSAVTAVGYGGQRIFILPQHKLVLTLFAGNYGNGIHGVGERVLAKIVKAAPGGH